MDPAVLKRMRDRRTRSHASQENLVKDSSSEASPRESTSSNLASRRRQRRAHRSPTDQQYDNQAFAAEDEHSLPPHIDDVPDDHDVDEEEENVRNADRLVSHVAKEHRRIANDLQQQNKKPKKPTTASEDLDQDQGALEQQIRQRQEVLSEHVGDADDRDRVLPLESTTTTATATGREKSIAQILELAKRARTGKSVDEDQQSTMGSSRRFGATSELRLQRLLRQTDTRVDGSQIGSPTPYDRSTRFDLDAKDDQLRRDIEQKREGRTNRWKDAVKNREDHPLSLGEQDDFFLKIWPHEKEAPKGPTTDPTTAAPTTTADGEAATTDEAAPADGAIAALAEKQPLLPVFGEAQPAQYQRADQEYDDDEQRDLENKRFKYVIGEELTLQDKLGAGVVEPRSLEAEGIFVGKKPVVPTNVVHRAEKRIIEECVVKSKPIDRWFGPDGAILSLPDPTKFVPTRPLIDDLFDPALGREFYKAYVVDSQGGLASDPIGADRYRLDIDLGTITFLHHHLMSAEHVLAMKIKQMYEHYTVRIQQRVVQQLSEKIKALKAAENNCRTLYEQNRYSDSSLPEELRNRLSSYQIELRQTRNQRCNEMKLDRQLLERLLSTWKKIKDVRRTNGYSTTAVHLIIKQISGKKTKHYEQIQRQIEEEIEDEIALADEEYQRAKEAHVDMIKKRKLQNIRKKEARKRMNNKRDAAMTNETADGDYDQTDVTILNEGEVIVPEKPEPRARDEIRTTILKKYQNAIRPPDEPEILLELVYSEPISTDAECTARERVRRHNVQTASNILARILINGKVIADTPAVPLSNEFEGSFSQIFPCYVVRTPETIKIELYEFSARFRSPIAELYLPIPESTVTSENYNLQSYEFSSNILRQFNPNQTAAVGAGIPTPVQFDDYERTYLNIEGLLKAGIAWGAQDGVTLVPPDYATSKAFRNRQMAGGLREDISMDRVNLNNMKPLIEWIKQSNLDPYDPENAFLIKLMQDHMGTRGDAPYGMDAFQHFRLWIDENDETDRQQQQAEVNSSLRFKLLQARKENIPGFRDHRRVPPYDYLVRKENKVFKDYLKRLEDKPEDETGKQQLTDKRPMRIDIVRQQGERQLRKIREQVLARFALRSGQKSYQDMVVEENIPNIQALRGFITKLSFQPVRPLYPAARRTEQRKVTNLTIAANRDVFILINIIAATDLPIRRDALESERDRSNRRDQHNTNRSPLLRPYIEIQFQKNTYRTSTVDGPNPSWNEELRIPFRPPDNDFDANSLQRCRDILYINVFDQCDVDLPTTDRERGQVVRKRIVRNWLGSVKIPFSNIYVNGRLEGSYRLSVPSPLLGYDRQQLTQTRINPAGGQALASVLRMFVTMEPILSPPEVIQQTYDSTESPKLLDHVSKWAKELHQKFPDRDFKATVSDTNGRAVFIPRFLRPLPLPPLVAGEDNSAAGGDNQILCQRLARFVSLIPFLADTVSFPGVCDIWETSDQFLRTMAGDDEEHAVLLNNYFRQLNKRSWIALGESIYSGPCAFVLTKDDGQVYPICWSVADGQDASTIDTWNPIRSIYVLANEENVWGNIQEQDLPSRMQFDVTNKSHWRPFFDGSFSGQSVPWTSVQPADLQYEATRKDDVGSLERYIYETLRDKILHWRDPNVTRWNWPCQKRLQDIIKRKEMSTITGRGANTTDIEQELAEFQSTKNITGFPLQMPYSNVQTIVETVYATKIFEHPTNEIEFALAVHIHSYPNNILAVWIYLAHLTSKT